MKKIRGLMQKTVTARLSIGGGSEKPVGSRESVMRHMVKEEDEGQKLK
jgi:hypothetical protein